MGSREERWLPVVGYEGYYEVSDLGRVKRVAAGVGARPGECRKQYSKVGGYPGVNLSVCGVRKTMPVHRMVLEAFVGPCPEGMETRHFPDRSHDNNRLENLSWSDHETNMRDKRKHGTQLEGAAIHNSVLRESDVLEIRSELRRDRLTQGEIAALFGVTRSTVSLINTGPNWSHLPLRPGEKFPIRDQGGMTYSRGRASIQPHDVLDVRNLLRNEPRVSVRDISALFGVSSSVVYAISIGKTWRNLPDSKHIPGANAFPCRPHGGGG